MKGQQEAGGEDLATRRVKGTGPAAEAGSAVVQRRFLRAPPTGISEPRVGVRLRVRPDVR